MRRLLQRIWRQAGCLSYVLLAGCMTRPVNVSLLPERERPDALFGAIAHFDIVSKANNVYRGGQPTLAGFKYLHEVLHVRTIVKLNTDAEGSDAEAQMLGMNVVKVPIPFSEQVFGGFDKGKLIAAIEENYHDVFIHCEHGEDRTGLACYYFETRNLGVSREQAVSDMLSHGFHKVLHGLWEAVEEDVHPSTSDCDATRSPSSSAKAKAMEDTKNMETGRTPVLRPDLTGGLAKRTGLLQPVLARPGFLIDDGVYHGEPVTIVPIPTQGEGVWVPAVLLGRQRDE